MSIPYFQNFPQIYYTFDPKLINFSAVVNIFTRVEMLQSVLNNIEVYYTYTMKDTDTVESIAYKYYGDTNRFWIILFTNQIIDPYFQLPLNQDVFNQKIVANYGSIANAQSTVHHIEKQTLVTSTNNGVTNEQIYTVLIDPLVVSVDGLGVNALPTIRNPVVTQAANSVQFADGTVSTTQVSYTVITNFDYEDDLNESHRIIKLVKNDYVNQIETELQTLLAEY